MVDVTLTVSEPQASSGRSRGPLLTLAFRADALAGPWSRHWLVDTDLVRLGRGVELSARRARDGGKRLLALTIPDRRMSSVHAELTRARGRWQIVDLASKNGVIVNGARVESRLLEAGDLIELGQTFFIFDDAAEGALAPADLRSDALTAPPGWQTLVPALAGDFAALDEVAHAPIAVKITGPPGTGKEVVAQALHARSGRPGRCIAVNCAAIAASVAEAELFGHRRGAFTGAEQARLGWIRSAHEGTLFLDEIGDLRLPAQALLLRALESRRVRPVGADDEVPVDFRLVAATNVDLSAAVAAGRFRADLFGRLGVVHVDLPPLAERRADLGLLVGALLARVGGASATMSLSAARQLMQHAWPGNVRELAHALEVAALRMVDGRIAALPIDAAIEVPAPTPDLDPEQAAHRAELEAALRAAEGNVSELCRQLGVHRQTAHRWFKRYGLDPQAYR